MFKKIGCSVMSLALLALTACGSSPGDISESDDGKLDVAFVLGCSISDGAYGTISYQGIESVKDENYIGNTAFVEGISAATDASKAIRDYIADGYDVVWAQSGQHSSCVMEIAPEFPDTTFVAIGAPPTDQTFDNVWFNSTEHEGAYYVCGVLAARTTASGVIGFVGGREHPLYEACAKAYEEGAHSVNPDIQVLSVFTGDFDDPIKAKEATASQIQAGADIIVHLQDLGMSGVFAAAEEATDSGNQVWVIGKGGDQYEQAPDVVLTSVIYDYGVQMRQILAEIAAGNHSGTLLQNMTNGSIYLADFRGRIPEDVIEELNEVTEQIIAGEITYTTQYDIT